MRLLLAAATAALVVVSFHTVVSAEEEDDDEVVFEDNDICVLGNTIAAMACNHTDLETLCDLLEITDLASVLGDETQSFTVFAPIDSAFEGLSTAVVEALVNDTGT